MLTRYCQGTGASTLGRARDPRVLARPPVPSVAVANVNLRHGDAEVSDALRRIQKFPQRVSMQDMGHTVGILRSAGICIDGCCRYSAGSSPDGRGEWA